MKALVVRGAREHNLRDVDLDLPRERLVVVTGPSGSGKSSLAFDTIYAEGQRRYVQSLSTYARQFLERLPRPDVDVIEGLSPAIRIQQHAASRNPRSTVGTVTEIHDYLRLLFARAGQPHCPQCSAPVSAQTVTQVVDRVLSWPEGTRFAVLAPVVRSRKGSFEKLLQRFRKEGFVRVRIDGEMRDLGEELSPDARRRHDVDLVIDRLSVKDGSRQRLSEAVELAFSLADGLVRIAPVEGEELLLSERFACPRCGVSLPEITPRMFSFNSPDGACPACAGLGRVRRFEPGRVVPDPSLSLREGAIAPWGKSGKAWHTQAMDRAVRELGVDPDRPWSRLPAKMRERVLHGEGDDGYEGVLPWLERRTREYERRKREEGADEERTFAYLEQELGQYASWSPCPDCDGTRLRPEALAVTVAGHNLHELTQRPVEEVRDLLDGLELDAHRRVVAGRVLREVEHRLGFLSDVGLGYLALSRAATTLSGGEAQRIRLATQIGAALAGVLYVLDEPSIGLHPRDNRRLIETLERLRDRGNTVLVVEHDADTIRAADYVVDMGPGAGAQGGRVVAVGAPEQIAEHPASSTGAFLSGRRRVPVPRKRRSWRSSLVLRDVTTHNLRGITAEIPLGVLTCVTGVSGSGKSSLIVDTLLPALRGRDLPPGAGYGALEGADRIGRVVQVDQAPIGRTPRSNPATYTEVFDGIRGLFASLPEARARGYKAGRFSFNVKGGRCEACRGAGVVRVEMHFLPDVFVTCEQCGGRRYDRQTLEVRYRGRSIADVLDMSVDEALPFFDSVPRVRDGLAALHAVGLGYLELGRSASTLSGGEAQRIKLARELGRRVGDHTLYILDEPTTGLHFADVEMLVSVLGDLVDGGHSVVVVEHHPDVVKVADHVLDLGPEGGAGGGEVVVAGPPEAVAEEPASHTGRHLRPVLEADRR